MMPILSGYKQFWTYTKTVLANTNLGETLAEVDLSGTVKNKAVEYRLEEVDQNMEFFHVLYQLYPEVFLK